MKLIGQSSTWSKGERTAREDRSRAVTIPLPAPTLNIFTVLVQATHDLKHHYGTAAVALELTADEWHSIRFSPAYLDTVRYCAAGPGVAVERHPKTLAALLGLDVRVEGLEPEPLPAPPPTMNCRNCGAPPKLNSRACVHCGTPWAASATPTREPSLRELPHGDYRIGGGGMPEPTVPLSLGRA